MKTKNFYLYEIKEFFKYCDNATEFDFVKVMTLINDFLETQKIKCVFTDINVYNKNIILDFETYNQRKIIENIFNEYGFVTKTAPNGLHTKDTGFWIVGVKEKELTEETNIKILKTYFNDKRNKSFEDKKDAGVAITDILFYSDDIGDCGVQWGIVREGVRKTTIRAKGV